MPAENFPTRDGWIVVFCNKDKFWRDLVESLDMHDLAEDPRFATFPARLANRATLAAALGERFATRTTAEWLERLRGRVPCAPVNDVRAALADEQVRAREMIVEVDHSEFGRLREARGPIRTEGEIRVPARAPKLGEHTEAILSEMLRYSDGAIARLRAAGAIG